MRTLRTATTIAAACLAAGCSSIAPPAPLRVEAVSQVRHAVNEVAAAYYQLGRHHQQKGDLELALSAYNYAAARDPRDPEARSAAAAIHAQQGRLAQAHTLLLAVSQEYPRMAQAHNNLGYIYQLQGDYELAAAAYRTALALAPQNDYARNNLALTSAALARNVARASQVPAMADTVVAATPVPPAAAAATAAFQVVAPSAGAMQLVALGPNHYHLKLTEPAAAAVVAQVIAQPAVTRAWRLEVANGNGEPGLARRARSALQQRGITVDKLSNERPFGRLQTTIEYRSGYADEARALQLKLGGEALLRQSDARLGSIDLRLVLGRNAPRTLALLAAADVNTRLASR